MLWDDAPTSPLAFFETDPDLDLRLVPLSGSNDARQNGFDTGADPAAARGLPVAAGAILFLGADHVFAQEIVTFSFEPKPPQRQK